MNEYKKLELEILTGPLDGYVVTLEGETEWRESANGSPLAFPWDDELGQPQSRFIIEDEKWLIEPYDSAHGTYIANRQLRLSEKTALQEGDLLKASKTWMRIKSIG